MELVGIRWWVMCITILLSVGVDWLAGWMDGYLAGWLASWDEDELD